MRRLISFNDLLSIANVDVGVCIQYRYVIVFTCAGIVTLIPTCCTVAQVPRPDETAATDKFGPASAQVYSVCALIPIKLASLAYMTGFVYFVGASSCRVCSCVRDLVFWT